MAKLSELMSVSSDPRLICVRFFCPRRLVCMLQWSRELLIPVISRRVLSRRHWRLRVGVGVAQMRGKITAHAPRTLVLVRMLSFNAADIYSWGTTTAHRFASPLLHSSKMAIKVFPGLAQRVSCSAIAYVEAMLQTILFRLRQSSSS